MKLNDMFPSNYLKKEDVPYPVVATIKTIAQEEIRGDGGKESKWVLYFATGLKPMILNKGNAEMIGELYGDDPSAWVGKSIEVYTDPSVMFGGKRVGGVRVRQPSNNPFHGSPATSHNGAGHVGRWDLSDGTKNGTYENLSADDVRKTILDSGKPANQWKAKPAGAPPELAKPVDQLGIVTTLQSVGAGTDPVPF